MRRYETVCIVNPSLSPEEAQPLFDKLTDLIAAHQGLMVKLDDWGHKRLAYEIKKQTRGYYILLDYCGNGSLVKELERNMRLDDRVLKYMTVCVAKEVDEEAIKTEIEAAEEAAKVKESSAEPTSPLRRQRHLRHKSKARQGRPLNPPQVKPRR